MIRPIIISLSRLIVCQRISHIQAEKIWNEIHPLLENFEKNESIIISKVGQKKSNTIKEALSL